MDNWIGYFAPANTPPAIENRINAEVLRIMQSPEIQEQSPQQGLTLKATTAQQFADFAKAEKDKWGQLVRATGIKAD